MPDINFEKYAADEKAKKEKKQDPLGRNMGLGALLGAIGGAGQGLRAGKADTESFIADTIEEGTHIYPTLALDELQDTLGPKPFDYYDIHVINPNLPESLRPGNAHLSVSRAVPLEAPVRKQVTDLLRSMPLKDKVLRQLHFMGRPVAIAALAGAAMPFISHIINNVSGGVWSKLTDRQKETTAENVAKAAAADYIDGLAADMEKQATEAIIDRIIKGPDKE